MEGKRTICQLVRLCTPENERETHYNDTLTNSGPTFSLRLRAGSVEVDGPPGAEGDDEKTDGENDQSRRVQRPVPGGTGCTVRGRYMETRRAGGSPEVAGALLETSLCAWLRRTAQQQ